MYVKLLKQFRNIFLGSICCHCCCGRCGGLMLSAPVSRPSSSGSSPGGGHCVVFLIKTLTLTVPNATQVYKWVRANFISGVNTAANGLATHPGWSRNTPCRFRLLKQEIPSNLLGHVASLQPLPSYLHTGLNYWKKIVVLIQQSRTGENDRNCCQPP